MFRILESVKTSSSPLLPLFATANDIRGVVNYLKKRASGVTVGEAVDGIKRQTLDPRKIAAYESLGIIVREGDRLKLSAHGWELARSIEPEARAFRLLLDQIEPYRALLDWVYESNLETVVHADAARYWIEHYPEVLLATDEKTIEGYLVCFFQLCQAAALGTHIVGKKGQPTRLRVDRDELLAYLKADQRHAVARNTEPAFAESVADKFSARVVRRAWRTESTQVDASEKMNVFISCGKTTGEVAQRIRVALDLADIESDLSERKETGDAALLAPEVVEALRRCDAGVFITTHEDCRLNESGELTLDENFQVEIGAAFVLYSGRILLVCEQGMAIPANLKSFCRCEYEGDDLSWETGVRLINYIKNFTHARSVNRQQTLDAVIARHHKP